MCRVCSVEPDAPIDGADARRARCDVDGARQLVRQWRQRPRRGHAPAQGAGCRAECTVQGYRLRAVGGGLWVTGYGLWVMGYGLWAMGYGLWAMGCELEPGLWVVGCGLWAMGCRLWVVN